MNFILGESTQIQNLFSVTFSLVGIKYVPHSDTDIRMNCHLFYVTQTYQELSAPVPRTELPNDNTTSV